MTVFDGSNSFLCDSHITVPNHRLSHAPQHKTVGLQTSFFNKISSTTASIDLGVQNTARFTSRCVSVH